MPKPGILSQLLGSNLTGRLVRVFLLQALAISMAVLVGIWATTKIIEDVLVREALVGEADHYWSLYDLQPGTARPNTRNLLGYLAHPQHGDEVPEWLAGLQPGYLRVQRADGAEPLVHISERNGARLYLVFDEIQVSRLVLLFGVAPLSVALLLIYLMTFLGYRSSTRATSPVVQLASRVSAIDFNRDDLQSLDFAGAGGSGDPEVQALADALQQFVGQLQQFLQRERNFTRNASHELRTPLAVMRANLDSLQRRMDPDAPHQRQLERMRRTVLDMEHLLVTLLMLAREDEARLPRETFILNDLLAERIDQVARAVDKPDVPIRLEAECLLQLNAPLKVAGIVFDNLLKNALSYTDEGAVTVRVSDDAVTVSDTGVGMTAQEIERAFFQENAEAVFNLT